MEATSWIETYRTHAQVIYEVDADIYQSSSLTEIEMEIVKGLFEKAGVSSTEPILDLACGVGRHAIELARLGHKVRAVDYSREFLEIARGLASNLDIKFEWGDVRALDIPQNAYRMATMLGNSFGFFDDWWNKQLLWEVSRVLDQKGKFVFDITDKDKFLSKMKPYSRDSTMTKSFGRVVDERWRSWEESTSTLHCRKRHVSDDKGLLLDTEYNLRLYPKWEITSVLKRVGFYSVEMVEMASFPDVLNFGAMSSRLFLLAQK